MKHLEIAFAEYGVKEIPGKENNPEVMKYSRETGLTWVKDDETAWCSLFANWVCMKAGLPRSGKANARSWLDVGKPVTEPQMGDIVVFKRGTSEWQGHVGFFMSKRKALIYVLGGNQGDAVKVAGYDEKDLLGIRRLT